MAISFIAATAAAANTVGVPASATAGDILIIAAYRSNNTGDPGTPTGATTIKATAGGKNFLHVARRGMSAGVASISSLNATHIGIAVYRGQHTTTPIGSASAASGASAAILLPGLGMTVTDGTSWVVGIAGTERTNGITFVSLTERFDVGNPNNPSLGLGDTNAGVASFATATATVTDIKEWIGITFELEAEPAATNRTLTAEATSYLHSGQTVQFDVIQPSDAGAYTEAGQAANFAVAMPALAGSFALAGQVVNLVDNNPQVVVAEAAAFTEAGQDVQFDVVMPAEAGAYTEAGQVVTLTATGSSDTPLIAEAGAYTEAGQSVSLKVIMSSAEGGFAESTQSGILDIRLVAEAASFALTGQDVADYNTVGNFGIVAEAGSFGVTGNDVTLTFTGGEDTPRGAGSGKMRYFEAGEEFWMVRQRYLERLKPKMDSPSRTENHETSMVSKAEQEAMDRIVVQRQKAYLRAQTALSYERLKEEERRIIELSGNLAKLRQQWDDVLVVLLLDS